MKLSVCSSIDQGGVKRRGGDMLRLVRDQKSQRTEDGADGGRCRRPKI
jgi:hypothetical protein